MELERFVFSKSSRLMNAPTTYRVLAWMDQNTVLEKQGRPPILPQCYLKIEKVGEIEVVDVRDNAESGVTCRRAEESIVDKNAKIF